MSARHKAMGGASRSHKRPKRTRRIDLALFESELAAIQRSAGDIGMVPAAYVRHVVLRSEGRTRSPRPMTVADERFAQLLPLAHDIAKLLEAFEQTLRETEKLEDSKPEGVQLDALRRSVTQLKESRNLVEDTHQAVYEIRRHLISS